MRPSWAFFGRYGSQIRARHMPIMSAWPAGQHLLGHDRVVDAAGTEDRQLDLFAHPGGQGDRVAERGVHRTFHQVEVVEGGDGEIHEIDQPGGLEAGHRSPEPGPRSSPPGIISSAHMRMPRVKSLPTALRTAADELERCAHAVLQASRRIRPAMIGQRRQELAGQAGVAELDLDAVETAFTDVDGALGKVAGDLFDILRLHRLGHLTEEDVRNRRSAPRPAAARCCRHPAGRCG